MIEFWVLVEKKKILNDIPREMAIDLGYGKFVRIKPMSRNHGIYA